ncbi:calcium-binding protein [Roseicella sp. DB1501]|uniref:calcium-binding protein n=1 Tax=Roseicella sp. DB1501 TaxID=2730925 RepID=UPI0020C53C18|nr:calcium-binding protein [Roseicella sp. DB1501]
MAPISTTITGTNNNDLLNYSTRADNLKINGLGGNDTVYGGLGNDTLYGATGNDKLYGGAGNNYMEGGLGSDTIVGGTGSDIIVGGGGNDMLYAGTGHDVFRFAPNDTTWTADKGSDTIIGFKGLGSGGQGDIIEFLNYGPDAHLEYVGSSAKVVGLQYYAVYATPGTEEVNRVDVIAIKLDAATAAAGRTLAEGDYVFHS